MSNETHTIWTATQALNIDNLKASSVLNILDMVSDGDSFLQMPCTIEDGVICVGSVRYLDADA